MFCLTRKTGRKSKMMRYFIAAVALLFSFSSFGQQLTYADWKALAKTEINLQPEYGNAIKTKGQLDADSEFIKLVLSQDSTRSKGSEHLVKLGFTYLSNGDVKTAMERFNQAWLLDPKNENSYWGYGAIYGYFNDYDTAIAEYDKGLLINPNSPVILTDKATVYFVGFQQDHDQMKLDKALKLLNQSYLIDAKNVNTTYKLSICYFLNKDCLNAWKFYRICEKSGHAPIAENYTEALKKMCAN